MIPILLLPVLALASPMPLSSRSADLSQKLYLTSLVFGRGWNWEKAEERAGMIEAAAQRHKVDPALMVAIDAYECDLRDRDASVYAMVHGRRRLVGYDACPMGMRIMGVGRRARYNAVQLYEMAAADLERSRKVCLGSGHPARICAERAVAKRNSRNRDYAAQVFAIAAALRGQRAPEDHLTRRTVEIVRRLLRIFKKVS